MNRVMTPRRGRQGEASRAAANAPTCPNTTRYDTRAALRRGAAPAEDDWVVAMVVRRRRTRRLTLVGDLPAAACKADMAVVRQASSGDAAGTIVSTSASQLVHCQHG